MQNPAQSNQIKQEIIKVILNNSNSQIILSTLASEVGKFFQVDACMIVSADIDSLKLLEDTTSYQKSREKGLLLPDKQGEKFNRVNQVSSSVFSPEACRDFIKVGLWQEDRLPPLAEDKLVSLFFPILENQESILEPIALNNRQEYFDSLLKEQFEKIPIPASLVIVTRCQDKANGLILLLKSQAYQWTSSEKELFIDVSESMAIAISQIQLQQQAQTRTRYQTLLNHLSREISQSSDVNSLFKLTLAEIGKALEVDRGFILLLKYKDPLMAQRNKSHSLKANVQVACSWSSTTNIAESLDDCSFSLSDSSWCQQALQQAPESLVIPEQASFPDLPKTLIPEFLEPNNTSALFMTPLMGNMASDNQSGLVLGFIVLQNIQSRVWLIDELDLVNWVGIQIATAIIHHQTLNQVQSLVEERTAQLKWSLDVQAKLSDKMRQQIEQLRQLNELKDDFLSSMSHELKTPLTSMKMAIKMLRQPQLPETLREKYLNILEQEWNREYNLIRDLLSLQKVESGELTVNPQELNLSQIVDELAHSFNQKWHPDKGLTLETNVADSSLTLYSDSESLQNIFRELLLNAGKYSDADTKIDLSITHQVSAKSNQVTITISNYGAGISAEELPHIFDKFRRGKGVTDRAVAGTGLGLALVKYLVEHLNGTINVKSEPTNEDTVFLTTFTIKLPQLYSLP